MLPLPWRRRRLHSRRQRWLPAALTLWPVRRTRHQSPCTAVHLMVDAAPAQGVPDPAAAPRAGPVPASAPPGGAPGVAAADASPVLSVPRRVRRSISRKRRQPLTLGLRIMVINAHEKGDSYARIQETLAPEATMDALRKTVERKRYYREAAERPGAMLNRLSLRGCKYPELDERLYVWFCVLTARGRKRIPVTYAYVGRKAEQIAADLDINGFKGSLGYVQGWAQRHQLVNVRLHGAAGSVDMDEARLRMTAIRSTLETFDAEFIYNMDETGLFYLAVPSTSFVRVSDRRRVRGSKAIKAKERVTLVLAVNATGTHKIPVALLGRAKQPLCFRPAGCVSPLPYFHQRNSWMDGEVFKKWLETVFLVAVRARTSEKVALIVDNLASHEAVEDEQLLFITLPPNTTAVFQPLDAGVIKCLKRRYKRRFLEGLIRFHTSSVGTLAGSAAGARPRSSLVSNGRANLLDVARIIQEEWACITAESIVLCWLRAFPPMSGQRHIGHTLQKRVSNSPLASSRGG